jgi:hypothetical protein
VACVREAEHTRVRGEGVDGAERALQFGRRDARARPRQLPRARACNATSQLTRRGVDSYIQAVALYSEQ